MVGNVREVASSFCVFRLFFGEEACKSHNFGVDSLLLNRYTTSIVCHCCSIFQFFRRERRTWKLRMKVGCRTDRERRDCEAQALTWIWRSLYSCGDTGLYGEYTCKVGKL